MRKISWRNTAYRQQSLWTFTDYETAKIYLNMQILPIVIKASGLALGKGVFICNTKEEAQIALESMMLKKVFGEEA